MSELYFKLREYFENTPREQLDKDWEDIKYLNDIGPDVILYANYVRHQDVCQGATTLLTQESHHFRGESMSIGV